MLIGVGNSERGNGGSKEDERLQVTGVTEVDQIQVSDTVASSLAHSITLYQGVCNLNTSKTKNDLEDVAIGSVGLRPVGKTARTRLVLVVIKSESTKSRHISSSEYLYPRAPVRSRLFS